MLSQLETSVPCYMGGRLHFYNRLHIYKWHLYILSEGSVTMGIKYEFPPQLEFKALEKDLEEYRLEDGTVIKA
jgi:hypothetical protein